MCKWCGTRYCKECLHGDFHGQMIAQDRCGKCHHPKCQGQRVEYVLTLDDVLKGKNRGGKSAKATRFSSALGSRKDTRTSKKPASAKRKSAKGKKKKRK